MTVPERRRALQAFEVMAYVKRGRQPLKRVRQCAHSFIALQ